MFYCSNKTVTSKVVISQKFYTGSRQTCVSFTNLALSLIMEIKLLFLFSQFGAVEDVNLWSFWQMLLRQMYCLNS